MQRLRARLAQRAAWAWAELPPQSAHELSGAPARLVASVAGPTAWALLQHLRRASTAAQPPFAATQALLEAAQAQQFQPRLEELREQHACLPFVELVAECRDSLSGGATEEDAQRVCNALTSAGVILRHGQVALLRPGDISEVLMQVLPPDERLLKQQLEAAQAQLAPLEERWQAVQRRLQRRSTALKWGGLGVLGGHWALFCRLTYWELSWDVMEPVAFLATSFYSILMYVWFMRNQAEFSYPEAQQRLVARWQERMCRKYDLDWEQYCALRRRVQRCSDLLRLHQRLAEERAAAAAAAAGAGAGGAAGEEEGGGGSAEGKEKLS